MNLEKLENPQKLELCKKYFKGGLFLLPFLWVVNSIWFFNEAFRKEEYDEQKEIKKCNVLLSMLGAIISTALFITWVVVFQTHRVAWGEFADNLSIVIPTGMP